MCIHSFKKYNFFLIFSFIFFTFLSTGCQSGSSSKIVDENFKINEKEFYLRGDFNNWGVKDKFIQIAPNKYKAESNVSLGVNGIKITSKNWEYQFNPIKNISDVKNESALKIPLFYQKTEDKNKIIINNSGRYQFILDLTNKYEPVLEISKLQIQNKHSILSHSNAFPNKTLSFRNSDKVAKFSIAKEENNLRTYIHSTTQKLRDPVPQITTYGEKNTLPYIRTNNIAFDALFALAVDEAQLNSVERIKDGSYNKGEPIDCDCFETGEKWNYVWTRDLSYSAHLGLGLIDPIRSMNSLDFKLSKFHKKLGLSTDIENSSLNLSQIIQDTGSGGSWPVSTDRVTWAFGAEATLSSLPNSERQLFEEKAFYALKNTIDNDRKIAFDINSGLYNGEQSFLDWREQSYAAWIPNDLSSMATSKALSTNVGHYQAIKLAATLAKKLNKPNDSHKYENWAVELKTAINNRLWLEKEGLYSSLTAGHFDNTPLHKFDWLGQSLAIITGIASSEQIDKILSNYPHGPQGAPVIFPQQQGIPIYHNRAIWPFVTAYGLKAAVKGKNISVANEAYKTLIRSAALNLSNMENMEWLSGETSWIDNEDVSLSGPVINSKRQLWSVAAYLNMVIENVFGIKINSDSIQFSPFITTYLRNEYFEDNNKIVLKNLTWRHKKIDLTIHLPILNREEQGFYRIENIYVNKVNSTDKAITYNELLSHNQVVITLDNTLNGKTKITKLNHSRLNKLSSSYAPFEPSLEITTKGKESVLNIIDNKNKAGVAYNIYKNGELVKSGLNKKTWKDSVHSNSQACYSVSAYFVESGNYSHNSNVKCTNTGQFIHINSDAVSLIKSSYKNKAHDRLEIFFNVKKANKYAFQLQYENFLHDINTGITCGVKWLKVYSEENEVVGEGAVILPHTKPSNEVNFSTPVILELPKGNYTAVLGDYYNMSYLQKNATYTGTGGVTGYENSIDIKNIKIFTHH